MERRARTKDKLTKREELISCAIQVFSRKGFHETKMQDVADESGVGKGTLYEYFTAKEELFLAVYDRWMDEYETQMKSSAESARDPLTRADAIIDTAIAFYEKHAEHAPLLLEFWAHALRSKDTHFIERIREMKKTLGEIGSKLTSQLTKLKAFTAVDPDSFARLELGISDGIFLQWVLDGQTYSLDQAYKFRQSVIGAGLMTAPLRTALAPKIKKRLKEGFLTPNTTQTKKGST